MARSVAFAYALAGTVVAAAVIVVAGSTVGLTGGEGDGSSTRAFDGGALPDSGTLAVLPAATTPPGVVASEVVATAAGEQVEYVYVDEPAPRADDEDDDDRYEHDGDRDDREHGDEAREDDD